MKLTEFFERFPEADYSWDYEESLEDILECVNPYDKKLKKLVEETDRDKFYKRGDIIMVPTVQGKSGDVVSPHRILIINAVINNEGKKSYNGFLLSSKVDKANKNGGYPNNIYINDYASILHTGIRTSKPAFIRVDEFVNFTSDDLSETGTWKGTASFAFMKFIDGCRYNYRNGISNANRYWMGLNRLTPKINSENDEEEHNAGEDKAEAGEKKQTPVEGSLHKENTDKETTGN